MLRPIASVLLIRTALYLPRRLQRRRQLKGFMCRVLDRRRSRRLPRRPPVGTRPFLPRLRALDQRHAPDE